MLRLDELMMLAGVCIYAQADAGLSYDGHP